MTRNTFGSRVLRIRRIAVLTILATAGVAPAWAQSPPPSFSKAFAPSTIGPGSVSTLTFLIDNVEGQVATDLAFTDTLPAGVAIATPAAVTSSCGGVVSAPDGGTTITLSGGGVAASSACAIAVNVTSAVVGPHSNLSGDLTSSAGNSGPASADLTVDAGRPGFLKSFSPAVITVGHTSTLTVTVDNTASAAVASLLFFTDNLPAGLVIANAANVSNTCGGVLQDAVPGSGTFSVFTGTVAAGATCTVSMDVVASIAGQLANIAGPLTSNRGASGMASAVLNVEQNVLTKTFTDDPVPPGGTVTLEFTLVNFDRNNAMTNIAFTDDLDATLSGLVATGSPASDVCGAGSSLTGTSLLTLSGGSLAPGESCTFDVTLQVPAGATPGTYPNTTSSVTADLGGAPTEAPAASDNLVVEAAPVLTKSFTDDPVAAGGTVTLEFTVTNTDQSAGATGINFFDDLTVTLPGVVAVGLPASGVCGAGSQISGANILFLSGGNLPAGGSCTFDVTLQLPAVFPAGTFPNTTSEVTATVGGTPRTGPPASDDLTVVAAPMLAKAFTDDPVLPGNTVTLEFTLTNGENNPGSATAIGFTDDLGAALSGLVAVGLPMNDVCGAGSQISGTGTLTFSGGSLAPGASCTFDVTLQVPAAAAPGSYTNTTSTVAATVLGLAVAGSPASDQLDVALLTAAKSFTDDPVVPGGTVTLQFTLTNLNPTVSVSSINFTDDLNAALAGLASVSGTVNDVCGAGSQISGTTPLIFTGGNLLPASSCTFSVTLQVPAAAPPGEYTNLTSAVEGLVPPEDLVTAAPASDTLTIVQPLTLTKSFTDDPVAPGGTVTLEFTVSNANASQSATGIAFTDDLGAALTGLVATGLPANDVCGAGSQITGTSVLTLTGGNLPPGGSCTFDVTLQVPAVVSAGTVVTNTTSVVTGTVGGVGVTGDPASDDLTVLALGFAKVFDGPVGAGGNPVLTFTITNLDPSSGVGGLAFLDDLNAVLPGLTAVGLPASDVCGPGSSLSGTSLLTLTNGSLGAGGTCTFGVILQVPLAAAPGTYPNTTSTLTAAGIQVAAPATADLQIEPAPLFSKTFGPTSIGIGGLSTLAFAIDNSASAIAASALDFTDNLPAGVVVASPPNASTTCTGGTLTAVAGTGMVSYSGGSVAAGGSCTVSVDVTATNPGDHVNTSGDLTSSSGNSGTATATLTANPQPLFSKAFAPPAIAGGGISTMTLSIDNTASTVAATALDLTDNLPAGVVVATPPNASTTCTGGTVTAVAGTGVISYTGGSVAAASSCTVSVDVTATDPGSYPNTAGPLTSSLGSSGTAAATLEVEPPPLVSKGFAPDHIAVGDASALTLVIDNTASSVDATGLDITDNLPAGMVVASPANAAATCTGGTLTAVAGTAVISYSGGTVAAGAVCTVRVDVTATTAGNLANTTGDLTSSLGSSGPATAVLVAKIPGIPALQVGGLFLLIGLLAAAGAWLLAARR